MAARKPATRTRFRSFHLSARDTCTSQTHKISSTLIARTMALTAVGVPCPVCDLQGCRMVLRRGRPVAPHSICGRQNFEGIYRTSCLRSNLAHRFFCHKSCLSFAFPIFFLHNTCMYTQVLTPHVSAISFPEDVAEALRWHAERTPDQVLRERESAMRQLETEASTFWCDPVMWHLLLFSCPCVL